MPGALPPIPLVSVVVPAYNAQATMAETLESIIAQTYENLEIIVVDDGSRDGTTGIVEAYMARDARISLLRQANGGVAAARNAGIARSSGEFIAPVDADDLWHPAKIARQMQVFAEGGETIGLVYTWFAMIDGKSRVIKLNPPVHHRGAVLPALAYHNFVGNGSSTLMRRSAFERTSGYDPTLRGRGGQGCEDWKLYMEVAEQYEFGLAEGYLTGYRVLAGNMSGDVLQMLRSRDLSVGDLAPRHPELLPAFRRGRNRLSQLLFHRALRGGNPRQIGTLLWRVAQQDTPFALRMLFNALGEAVKVTLTGKLRRGGRKGALLPGYSTLDPDSGAAVSTA